MKFLQLKNYFKLNEHDELVDFEQKYENDNPLFFSLKRTSNISSEQLLYLINNTKELENSNNESYLNYLFNDIYYINKFNLSNKQLFDIIKNNQKFITCENWLNILSIDYMEISKKDLLELIKINPKMLKDKNKYNYNIFMGTMHTPIYNNKIEKNKPKFNFNELRKIYENSVFSKEQLIDLESNIYLIDKYKKFIKDYSLYEQNKLNKLIKEKSNISKVKNKI